MQVTDEHERRDDERARRSPSDAEREVEEALDARVARRRAARRCRTAATRARARRSGACRATARRTATACGPARRLRGAIAACVHDVVVDLCGATEHDDGRARARAPASSSGAPAACWSTSPAAIDERSRRSSPRAPARGRARPRASRPRRSSATTTHAVTLRSRTCASRGEERAEHVPRHEDRRRYRARRTEGAAHRRRTVGATEIEIAATRGRADRGERARPGACAADPAARRRTPSRAQEHRRTRATTRSGTTPDQE